MRLSICMMVKNEEQNLERCLNSLKDLRASVNSELIIVDTGSTDNTVTIAKRYTDKVFFHEWNDNFSEMRNISISYARGEWLFIIDADEELVDSKNLYLELNRVNSQYNAIAINLQNVILSTGKKGSKLITMRFFKNDGNFRYEGVVHNKPVVHGNAIKVDSLLYHYGYIADDENLMEEKFIRTSGLLLKELENNPKDIYYLYQLGTSYDMHKDSELALEYYTKAYNLVTSNESLRKEHFYLYGSYVKCLVSLKEYKKAIKVSAEGLEIQKDYIDLIYFSGLSSLIMKEYSEGINMIEKYLKMVSNLEDLEIYSNPNVQLYTANAADEAIVNLTSVYNELENYEMSYKWIKELIPSLLPDYEYFEEVFNNVIVMSVSLNQFDLLQTLLSKVDENKKFNYELRLYKELIKITDYNQFTAIVQKMKNMNTTLSNILNQTINGDLFDLSEQALKYFSLGVSEVFLGFLKSESVFKANIIEYSESFIMTVLGELESRYDYFTKKLKFFFESAFSSDQDEYVDIYSKRMFLKYKFLIEISSSNCIDLFTDYINMGFKQIEYKYNENYLIEDSNWNLLNGEEQLLILLYKLKSKPSIDILNQAINIMPEWKKVILAWTDKTMNQSSSSDELKELKELSRVIKQNINQLMNDGMQEAAFNLIEEYLNICPDDLEMVLLKTQLLLRDEAVH